jgi:hypothetical protein
MFNVNEHVHQLIAKASQASTSENAMRYSQAACNAANAAVTLEHIKREQLRLRADTVKIESAEIGH